MTHAEKIRRADHYASKYLALFNELIEAGENESDPKVEAIYRKTQHWLDRLNKLNGDA